MTRCASAFLLPFFLSSPSLSSFFFLYSLFLSFLFTLRWFFLCLLQCILIIFISPHVLLTQLCDFSFPFIFFFLFLCSFLPFFLFLPSCLKPNKSNLFSLCYSWVCGLTLECGWPSRGHTLKLNWLSLSQKPSLANISSVRGETLCLAPSPWWDFCLTWASKGLMHMITTAGSSCVQLPCYVLKTASL